MATEVVDNASAQRFEIRVDGELAGFAEYALATGRVSMTHTEIDERFSGQGLGGMLVRAALDEIAARGLAVLPFCPFVRGWITKHPEYRELVPPDRRAGFGL